MKKGIFVLVATMCCGLMMAQNAGVSKPISVNIVKEIIPAILDIVPGSVEFVDKSGNNAIDANETCYIRFQVRNTGKGDGIGCKVKISATGTANGVRYVDKTLPTIAAGSTQTVEIPLTAGMGTLDGVANFRFEVTEPQGFGTDPGELSVATKAFVNPMLQIVDYSITSSTGSSQLQKKSPFDLQLMLQNTQYGKAENVQVRITLPEGVLLIGGEKELINFATINGGGAKSLVYSLIVANNYANTNIPVKVELKEKWGKYAENKTINLQLNQTMASNKLVVDEVQQQREEIQIAQIGSAVDKNIPHTDVKNKNTFALIIANENYKHVAQVPFARNDGEVFRQYCLNTLGLPEKNIKFLPDATLNDIKSQLNWLQSITDVWDNPQVIVYYAGHGIPDESNKSAYLLPVDGNGTDVSTGYKLDDLYAVLGKMPATHITVFMDACFSGSQRGSGMLASARGIALKAKSGVPQGKMVVFSAAQGDETAYPNNEEGHGMFTYYLLKKLQETKGDVTMQELGNYIIKNVQQQSVYLNGKSQTPCVTPASAVVDSWQNWKLK